MHENLYIPFGDDLHDCSYYFIREEKLPVPMNNSEPWSRIVEIKPGSRVYGGNKGAKTSRPSVAVFVVSVSILHLVQNLSRRC